MRVEKTVFISYRRTNASWALAVYQYLSKNGYDVFFDFTSIPSGDFEQSIIGNIKSRAHFLLILTPSALERVNEPNDWLRREIETALDEKRNIVPLMLEGFDYSSPSIAKYLTGKLEMLPKYNAVRVPIDYFEEALARICNNFLNKPLDLVLHPASPQAQAAAVGEKKAANNEGMVTEKTLSADEWFEKGNHHYYGNEYDDAIEAYSEAIRLKPDFHQAYNNRGDTRWRKEDYDGAINDFDEAISFKPDYAEAYCNRGRARVSKGDYDGAINDFDEAISLEPDYDEAYYHRGLAYFSKRDYKAAKADFEKAIEIDPKSISSVMASVNLSTLLKGKI